MSEREYLIAKAFRVPNAGTIRANAKKGSKVYNHHPIHAKAKGPASERAGSLMETQSLGSSAQRRSSVTGM
jgi:hypothetical protein